MVLDTGTWSGQASNTPASAEQLSDMISGWGANGIIGYGGMGVDGGGNFSGAYMGAGVMTPLFGVGGGYTWQLGNLPLGGEDFFESNIMISGHPVTIEELLVFLVCTISFLAFGIYNFALPKRIQKSDMRRYENLPSFLKFFRSPDYIKSRRFIWVTRAWGLVAIAAGILTIVAFLWRLFGPKS